MDRIQSFREWFVGNGGYISPECSIETQADSSTCVTAKSNLEGSQNIVICTCPFQLSLSCLNVLAPDHPQYEKTARQSASEIAHLSGRVADQVVSCFFLIEQRLLGEQSFWKPYIDLLPAEGQLMTPLYFSDEDLKWTVGTTLHAAIPDRRQTWQANFEKGCEVLQVHGVDAKKYTW
jgi:hypothetical protein